MNFVALLVCLVQLFLGYVEFFVREAREGVFPVYVLGKARVLKPHGCTDYDHPVNPLKQWFTVVSHVDSSTVGLTSGKGCLGHLVGV